MNFVADSFGRNKNRILLHWLIQILVFQSDLQEFLLALALCHTVEADEVPEEQRGDEPEYVYQVGMVSSYCLKLLKLLNQHKT